MMDPLYGTQLTDQLMANPWMLDPTQKSNQFSQYNNKALPYPPTYNGVPTDAMGRPIQSFLDWQKANPGGTTLNSTPAQPAQAPPPQTMRVPNPLAGQPIYGGANPGSNGGWGSVYQGMQPQYLTGQMTPQQQQAPSGGAGGGATGQSAAPNNWQAAINALANPGNPQTMGANVPLVQGYQPSGGVNQAFLNQAGSGAGMNQNFLSALAAIQGRPQPGGGGGAMAGGAGQSAGGLANTPFTNYGDMGGAGGAWGAAPPPGAANEAPKNIGTQGYLDANGMPTQALNALRQPWMQAQGKR
jgi:hypothetical protein